MPNFLFAQKPAPIYLQGAKRELLCSSLPMARVKNVNPFVHAAAQPQHAQKIKT
jgi:hypothetical protein